MQYRLVSTAALAALIAACGDPEVGRRDGGGFLPDAGSADPPRAPRLGAVASPVPWPLATLRGEAATAQRVIVEGGGNPIASTVLPDGTFCVDVPLPSPDTYALRVLSQNAAGFSETAAAAEVVFDPAAPPIAGLTTCSGADPAGCIGSVEVCDNGIDDDCNGLRDDRDPACAACTDDVLEPNDDTSAPRLEPGRYDGLRLCPGSPDYFGIFLRVGDALRARLFFTHADGDLDLALLAPDHETVLESAISTDDDETLDWTAAEEGEHMLHVYGVGDATNDYSLDLEVVRAM